MSTNRLEAFSDGVIAILITIMVLEIKVPHGDDLAALRPLVPVGLSYLLSFVYLGIYWNNHHHLFHATDRIDGNILWANLHLLFWLSLLPWATNWVGENPLAQLPAAIYGVVFFMAGVGWLTLQQAIIKQQGPASKLKAAVGKDVKGKTSAVLYASAVGLAFVHPWIADGLYVVVAMMWLIPDRRIESTLMESAKG